MIFPQSKKYLVNILVNNILVCVCMVVLWLSGRTETKNVRNMYTFKGIDTVHKDHNMVIFVLDKTIWPFRVDHLNESLAKLSEIKSSDLGNLRIYPETHSCLDFLQNEGYILAAVYSCKVPNLAENLLDAFDLTRYFAYQVCSEKDKASSIVTLHTQSGVDFEDMLYFDYDLKENLGIFELNVTFCPIDDNGISMKAVERALKLFNVRTTLKPPLSTTEKHKTQNDSSEYSVQIDYKELKTFTHLKTEEAFASDLDEKEKDEEDY
ncbi:magnesium-dependent phosphatase 1-like [Macrosteles quadrilineatus]|uniref:magnesium-dependent phosphatase 1-like n=1 Tax=Macrosteles quadrilineatus TaxID=74068 RepID=UPI0023E2525E|nr:magnesium-dependent phosphatase 1-like [Macrosteles quadrilineatus]